MLSFSWIDYIIFCILLLVSLAIGAYFGFYKTNESTITNYLLGGRKMKVVPIATSLVAWFVQVKPLSLFICYNFSNISTLTLLSVPVEIYLYGANYLWFNVTMILVALITINVFLPVFYNLQLTSIYEYLERRFDQRTRLFTSFLAICHLLLYLPTVLYILALSFSTVSGINVSIISTCVSCICVFYTAFGGLKSVVWNDILQMIVMVATLFIVLVIGVGAAGGPSAVWTKAKESGRLDIWNFYPDPTQRDGFWNVIIGSTVTWLSHGCVSQSSMLKFQSVPTYKGSKIVVVLFAFGAMVMSTGSIIQGLVIYAKYAECDPLATEKVPRNDGLVTYYVTNMAENMTGLPGIFVAGIFSAGLSTVSTHLNSMSGVIYKDFVARFLKDDISEARACTILKIIVVVTGTVSTLMVLLVQQMGGVFQFVISGAGLFIGPQLGMFSLGLLIPRANAKGSFYGAIAGLISVTFVFVMAKYYEHMGMISHPFKPLSVSGCLFLNETKNFNFSETNTTTSTSSQVPALFRISFYYYPFVGFAMTLILGVIISYLTNNKRKNPVDKKYIAPICHSLLPAAPNDGTTDVLMKPIKT